MKLDKKPAKREPGGCEPDLAIKETTTGGAAQLPASSEKELCREPHGAALYVPGAARVRLDLPELRMGAAVGQTEVDGFFALGPICDLVQVGAQCKEARLGLLMRLLRQMDGHMRQPGVTFGRSRFRMRCTKALTFALVKLGCISRACAGANASMPAISQLVAKR